MPVSDYYEALVFEDGKKFNVSRTVNTGINDQVHWHPYVEVLLSLSDGNKAAVNFNGHDLRVNDIVVIYPGELHSVYSREDDSWLIIQFPLELLTALGELNSVVSRFARRHYVRYDPISLGSERMVTGIKQIAELYYSQLNFKETKMYACMLNFFADLGEYWTNAENAEGTESGGAQQESLKLMAEACLYITDHCGHPLTLEDVARHVGISRSHFSHLFKRYTNMTFVDYLTTERVRRAEAISMDPSRHITDIAFEAGFSSISTFNRAFRKVKGVSPSEFREKLIN